VSSDTAQGYIDDGLEAEGSALLSQSSIRVADHFDRLQQRPLESFLPLPIWPAAIGRLPKTENRALQSRGLLAVAQATRAANSRIALAPGQCQCERPVLLALNDAVGQVDRMRLVARWRLTLVEPHQSGVRPAVTSRRPARCHST